MRGNFAALRLQVETALAGRVAAPFSYRDRKLVEMVSAGIPEIDALTGGLPRGGLPVAYEIAQALRVPMDALLVRKLGVPSQEELAFGAIAAGGVRVIDESLVAELGLAEEATATAAEAVLLAPNQPRTHLGRATVAEALGELDAARLATLEARSALPWRVEPLLQHDVYPLMEQLLGRGHTVLLYQKKFLFSGDHLAWSPKRNTLIAFRSACWYSWAEQIKSMERLLDYDFEWVLPGHGRIHHDSRAEMHRHLEHCVDWMKTR